jgi:hypothetical protein
MQQWEYCVLTGVVSNAGGIDGSYPKLTFFSLRGMEKIIDLSKGKRSTRPKGWEDVEEYHYIAAKIAELGIQGWEMVGIGGDERTQGTGPHCIYFRRQI